MSFVDPTPFRPRTPVAHVSDDLSEVGDAYREAIDDEAEAENAYLFVFQQAYAVATEDGIAVSVRKLHCDNQPDVLAAKVAWNRARAAKQRAGSKASETKNRLMGAMSDQRFIRDATGG